MTVSNGQPNPPLDLTYDEALAVAQKDFARLFHLHEAGWQVDVKCTTVWWRCRCDNKLRNSNSMAQHILDMVRAARGPVKK